jgi:hypothetical protein
MRLTGLSVLLLCAATLWAQQDAKKQAGSNHDRVGLIELEASRHLAEGPIRGGSYDDSFKIKRARYYVPDLRDCSEKILSAAEQWAASQGAATPTKEHGPGRVLVHITKPNILPAFYELLYLVDLDKSTAQVTFVLYRRGVPSSPDADPSVQKLVPMLKEALTCVQPASSSSH